jgi:hypothetical protein
MPTTKSLTMKMRKAKPTKLWVMSVDLVGCLPLPEPAGPALLVTSHIRGKQGLTFMHWYKEMV